MLNWLKERQGRSRNAQQLYGAIVAQARQPAFYAYLGVPDTARGRFEVIALHVALMMHRLQSDVDAGADLARKLGEAFVVDMDDNMREMTFSDLAVPREIKKAAAALFDRHMLVSQLGAPSPEGEADPWVGQIEKSLSYLAVDDIRPDVAGLARYLRRAHAIVSAQSIASLVEQGPQWPAIAS